MRDCSYCSNILSPIYTQDQINNLKYNNFLGVDRSSCDKDNESIRKYKSYVAYLFNLYFPNSKNNTPTSTQNQISNLNPNLPSNLNQISDTNQSSNQYPNQNDNQNLNTESNPSYNPNQNSNSNSNQSSNTGTTTTSNQYPNQNNNQYPNTNNSPNSNIGSNQSYNLYQSPNNSQLDGTNTLLTDFLIGTNNFTILDSLSDEEIQLIMKYKERVDNYFDAMIPSIYLSGIEENSVYYIDSQGYLVNESSSSLFVYVIKLIKVYLVALYVYIDYVLNIQDVSENRMHLLLNLVKSFGCYDQLLTLPAPILMNFLYNIIAIYRNKGSAYSLRLFIENVLRKKDRVLEGYMYSAYDYSSNSIKLFVDFRDPFTLELVQTKYADELGLRGNFMNNNSYSLFSG